MTQAKMISSWKQLFYLSVVLLQAVGSQKADNACTNQYARAGRCVPLRDCPSLFKLANRPVISAGDRAILVASRCGNLQTFCCEDVSVVPTTTSTTTSTEPPQPRMELPDTSVCGLDSSGERIIGGERTEMDQFRWTVALDFNTQKLKGVKCGGSLINTRYIITAAHCVHKVTIHELTARLGEWDLENDPDCDEYGNCAEEVRYEKIDRILIHPAYTSRQNDIALLRLESALPSSYTKYILPICLPVSNELRSKTFSSDPVTVSGWGATEKGTSDVSRYKMFAELATTSLNYCIEQLQFNLGRTKLDQKHLCAVSPSSEATDTCGGDSGGPLQINWKGNYYLIGVVSFGARCGETLLPGVYARITHYIDWIQENLVE